MIEALYFYLLACGIFCVLLVIYTIKVNRDERIRLRREAYIRAAWKHEFEETHERKDR